MKIRICTNKGVEGPSLSVEDGNPRAKRRGGRRVAGPKPWGGGETLHEFFVDSDELRDAIEDAERLTEGGE